MYHITSSRKYQKKIKRLRMSGDFKEEVLREILRMLAAGSALPSSTRDHALSGDLNSSRECHIKGDLLLIYKRDDATRKIVLADIGTHHQLFGN